MTTTTAPALSVVVPVYNEEGNVAPLFAEIREVMAALGRPFEVLFVNDGSTDGTLAALRRLAAEDAHLRIIELDGNFGEAAALCAGFRAARGELVITMDGDGQNDPHDIPRLLAMLEANGYRAVSGWRKERQEGLFLRVLPSRIANRLIIAISGVPVHDCGCGLKVYCRPVVAKAALPRGMNRFMPAIFGVRANEVAEVPVSDRRRQYGQSHYGISRTVIVLRDLLALRFIIAGARRSEPIVGLVGIVALLLLVHSIRQGAGWFASAAALVAVVAALIGWNLRRFNRAQRHGVFRVRREYSGGDGERGPRE
jgi:glycosyltransferase involved in cell wall biosynthesis